MNIHQVFCSSILLKGVDIFYAGLGGGGDFGGGKIFFCMDLGGHDFFGKSFGGARFFVYNCNPKKNYIIFSIYRYSGIIFLSMRIFHFVFRFPDSPVF